jgi:hypothetical protein
VIEPLAGQSRDHVGDQAGRRRVAGQERDVRTAKPPGSFTPESAARRAGLNRAFTTPPGAQARGAIEQPIHRLPIWLANGQFASNRAAVTRNHCAMLVC